MTAFRNITGKFLLFFVTCIVITTALHAQVKTIGLPVVMNYTTDKTGASTHSWDIIQDQKGVIYFANDAGVLKFNGEGWQLFPVSNGSIVRSLATDNQGRIYVGAYTEIGMLEPDSLGEFKYHKLNHIIPEKYRRFDDVWKIYSTDYGIIFQSFEYLFILKDDSLRVIEPKSRFGFSYYIDKKLYIVEKDEGLKVFDNGVLRLVSDDPLFNEDEIRFILPWKNEKLLIGSFSGGIYVLEGNKVRPWNTELNDVAIDKKLYTGIRLDDQILIGTIYDGIFICDYDGRIIQHINRSTGLQNNTILSAFRDSQNNLWLGLDNGIDYLKISLPVSFLNYNIGIETVYASIIFQNRLYVGTNQGLFSKDVSKLKDYRLSDFSIVEGTEGQVWTLQVEDGELLCGHNRGAYRITGDKAVKISEGRGVWNFFHIPGDENLLLSGTYDGLITYRRNKEGHWEQNGTVKGLELSSRKIVTDKNENIWISHDHEGIFRVRLSSGYDSAVVFESYNDSDELLGELPYKIHLMDDQFFVSTNNGCFIYDHNEDRFEESDELNKFFKGLGRINLLHIDQQRNRWYFSSKRIGLFRLLEDGTYIDIYTPFLMLKGMLLKDYENIYTYDHRNVFIGTINGLVHFDAAISKDYFREMSTYIDKATISNRGRDSVLIYGSNEGRKPEKQFVIDYGWNTLAFRFFCADLENTDNIEFSFRLTGFTDEWSDWTESNEKEYTNLSDGKYVFEVKSRNIFNNISTTDRIYFTIKAPYYLSRQALILYIVLFIFLALTIVLLVRRRISFVRSYEKGETSSILPEKRRAASTGSSKSTENWKGLKSRNLRPI